MSREQIVRDTAYAIWEAEGRPEGRDADHWKQAEERVASLADGAKTTGQSPAKSRSKKPAEAVPAARRAKKQG